MGSKRPVLAPASFLSWEAMFKLADTRHDIELWRLRRDVMLGRPADKTDQLPQHAAISKRCAKLIALPAQQ